MKMHKRGDVPSSSLQDFLLLRLSGRMEWGCWKLPGVGLEISRGPSQPVCFSSYWN